MFPLRGAREDCLKDNQTNAIDRKKLLRLVSGRFFKHFARRAAKRERGHAPHASNGEQARRIRHSTSLLAPKARPGTAARAPLYVNSMNGRLGRHDEERWC